MGSNTTQRRAFCISPSKKGGLIVQKNNSWASITILTLLLLGIILATTNFNFANTLGFFVGSLLSPFIITTLINRKTHWDTYQKIAYMLALAIIFQVILLMPFEFLRNFVSLVSFVSLFTLVIVIVIELFTGNKKP